MKEIEQTAYGYYALQEIYISVISPSIPEHRIILNKSI